MDLDLEFSNPKENIKKKENVIYLYLGKGKYLCSPYNINNLSVLFLSFLYFMLNDVCDRVVYSVHTKLNIY